MIVKNKTRLILLLSPLVLPLMLFVTHTAIAQQRPESDTSDIQKIPSPAEQAAQQAREREQRTKYGKLEPELAQFLSGVQEDQVVSVTIVLETPNLRPIGQGESSQSYDQYIARSMKPTKDSVQLPLLKKIRSAGFEGNIFVGDSNHVYAKLSSNFIKAIQSEKGVIAVVKTDIEPTEAGFTN